MWLMCVCVGGGQDDRVKVFGDAWDCVYDGELKLQEVGRWVRPRALLLLLHCGGRAQGWGCGCA